MSDILDLQGKNYHPKYLVKAGSYRGTFDLGLDKLLAFLSKFAPDNYWQAETYQIIDIQSGEMVAEGKTKEN